MSSVLDLFEEWDDEDEEFNEDQEHIILQAGAYVGSSHVINHCSYTPCHTAPIKAREYVDELLESAYSQQCQDVLRMPSSTFQKLVALLSSARMYYCIMTRSKSHDLIT